MPDRFLDDPLWYKDAVIYELHVRSFNDANDDGFGDFQGLRERLPYLERLGVNTLWLLPFVESPLKDDGYDTSDYTKVLPIHGDLDDFQAFLDEAHARDMRVVTELVLNHTSDQHPWFQEARDPASDKHDWYVWSETEEKYEDVRIIFTDTEDSNWTWDPKAQKYYWHRFFSHQPDLNYDNPAVRETMKEVMFFWLDMGVDGLRLDAVPYLFEREGTNGENLPETIDYVKELRAAIEARYGPGKVLLAEANQWPEDTLPYFGDADAEQSTGVQMAFNFPIMPRMYMALRRENRRPLVEMLEQTRDIPDDAQWAIFLRNHDELTLEMVTDEERDYMYNEYAAEDRFRINVGIRRRLAPLLGGERRRIELMNALLFSLKGSPVVYYGDEIGMGDDPFLGDRNGVRTPMQWSPDRNGGFSRAPHHKLFMPPINRGQYSYEFVNVEDAERDPHSLLHFMRRLITLRQQHKEVFGRGTLALIPVDNQRVLTFVRAHEGEQILVMANLSRFAQSVTVPPHEALAGHAPVELLGQTAFPQFEADEDYHMVLAPHGFYWFKLTPADDLQRESERRRGLRIETGPNGHELPVLRVSEGLQNLLVPTMARDRGPEQLEALLPDFIQKQRWFGGKSSAVDDVYVADAVRLHTNPSIYLSILAVETAEGTSLYTLPLTVARVAEATHVLEDHPTAAVAWIDIEDDGRYLVYDATVNEHFWAVLFQWWQSNSKRRSLKGLYVAEPSEAVAAADPENVRLLTGEQSNTSAIVGDQFFVKLYRRLEEGINPEQELLDHLTSVDFTFAPRLHGTMQFRQGDQRFTLGILQEALPVETDGWNYALDSTTRFLDRVAQTRFPGEARLHTDGTHYGPTDDAVVPVWLEEVAPEMISLARVLGVRTAEMHRALHQGTTEALRPQPADDGTGAALAARIRDEAQATRDLLADRAHDEALRKMSLPQASDWAAALDRIEQLAEIRATPDHIRIHGDYHLGQVLRADGDFYLLDFEGEPARSIAARRQRDNALRDVAGMLRSLEYAVLAAWQDRAALDAAFEPWIDALIQWSDVVFLDAYADTARDAAFLQPKPSRYDVLWAYLFEKALYEVRYELNHRPSWAWLPLRGLNRLLHTEARSAPSASS
ncbi:maltose alpha-D-glucosyltransferase [Salisaeta longa]|uniref:maltose alpha-D-glucosyltransferase n=1 Tax=Salisaeta longa TaxID=503170 RepID=UPI0003F9E1D0|nr:maltose alpha-D-glucosyltransferase [Salisaeta longa]